MIQISVIETASRLASFNMQKLQKKSLLERVKKEKRTLVSKSDKKSGLPEEKFIDEMAFALACIARRLTISI